MPGKIEFKIHGVAEVEAALKKLGPTLANTAGDAALRAMAKPIVQDARARAPRDTGKYARAIRFALTKKRGGREERTGFIGARRPWSRIAHLLEFGHRAPDGSHVAARPHLRPALDARVQDSIKAGAEALARNLKTVAEKIASGAKVRTFR